MMSLRELGLNNFRAKWGIFLLGIVLFSGGIAQAAPQYAVTCDFCHRMPPLDSANGTRDPATGAFKGNHQGHAGATATSCAKCHGNAVLGYNTSHRDKLIQVQVNINKYGGAAYSRVFINQTTLPPNPLGSCSNVNCHFESATLPWGSAVFGSPGGCGQCHGAPPSDGSHPGSSGAGKKHGDYYGTSTGSCVKCHPDHTVEGKPFSHATSAGNRSLALQFSAAPNSGGTYSTSANLSYPAYLPSQTAPASRNGTCSGLYCHSNGDGGGPITTPTWGGSLGCTGCHGGDATTTAPIATGKHPAHINNAGALGVNFGCIDCHAKTVSDNTTVSNRPNHLNKFKDYSGARAGGSARYDAGAKTCTNIYCHSNGKGGYANPPDWSSPATLGCNGCHGIGNSLGVPDYANGGAGAALANSHGRHALAASDCGSCHTGTTVSGTAIKGGSTLHNDGKIDVTFDTAKAGSSVDWIAGTKTCTNISCHGTTSAQWGSTSCLGCHSVAQGNRAAITSQFGANSHHIQGAVTDDKCYQCHWEANIDGSINPAYHHSSTPGAPVELVVYGAGTRPATYTASAFVAYSATGTRAQLQKINRHCLGCHSTQNDGAQPFGDGKTPKQYAWDGKSVDARYSQPGTTKWGKYPGLANAAPKNIDKAFSAHGNLAANQRGWDTTNGVDGVINNTGGTVNVLCYDCHNSHGSTVTGTTTSYASATANGGLLKDTTVSRSGYTVAYKPYSGGSTATKDKRNAGANLCLDCHLNQTATTTPWGYATYEANQPVLGYWDAPKYSNYTTTGPEKRYPYKKMNGIAGGHFGASMTMNSTPTGTIGGLCTPCHDPHGVSPTLTDQQYAVPLLKGTWLTSPYKEDVAPANNTWFTNYVPYGEGVQYHIDQNTFGSDIRGSVAGVTEPVTQSAGLCLGCHPQSSLTAPASPSNPNPWKSKNRIHESVKGWKTSDGTVEHNYTCSKCHSAHTNSCLPRLMVTNCLDSSLKGRAGNNPAAVTSWGTGGSGGGGYGRIPGSYGGGGTYNYGPGGGVPAAGDVSVTCHDNAAANDAGGTTQNWNQVTPWVYNTPLTSPTGISGTPGNGQATFTWTAGTSTAYSLIRYGTTSGVYGTTIDAANSPLTITGLTNGNPIYFRVGARNTTGTTWSAQGSVTPTASAPAAPAPTATPGYGQAGFTWSAIPGATSYSIRYGTVAGVYPTTVSATSSQTIFNLSNGRVYYYQVGAVNAAGTTWSAQGSVTPSASAPSNLYPTSTAGYGQATISWNAISGATSYAIRYGTAAGVYTTTILATSPKTFTGLTNGTTYYYQVAAINTSGTSWSSEYGVTPSTLVPAAPAATVTAGNGQAGFTWPAVTGATSYRIRYGTVTGVYPTTIITTSPQTIFGLSNGTQYYYQVASVNAWGATWSAEGNVTPTASAPAAPVPTATAGNGQAGFTWSAVSGATSYSIRYGTLNGVYTTTIPAISPMTITGLSNGTPIYYQVGAINASGSSWSAQGSVTPTASAPAPPAPTVAAGNGQANFSWLAVSGATSYAIRYGTVTGVYPTTVSATLSQSIAGLNNGTTYYYQAGAINASGTTWSAEGNVIPLAGVPAAPTGISATPGNGSAIISWTDGTNSTSSLIKYGTTSGTYGTPIAATSPQTITGLTNGTTIYYRIGAVNGLGTTLSDENSVTPGPPAAPTGISATSGNGQVTISWTAGTGAVSSLVRYGTSSGIYGTTVDPATPGQTITGLANGTVVYYQVGAKNIAGITWSAEFNVTPGTPPVPTPVLTGYTYWTGNSYYTFGYSSDCANPSSATVTWNPVTAPDGDPVEYNVLLNGTPQGWQSGTSFTFLAGPQGNDTWTVKARDVVHTWAESAYYSSLDLHVWDGSSCTKSSCPLVYSWNGAKFTYETDLQGPAISQIWKPGRYVNLYQPSYIVLDSLVPDATQQYRVNIWESLPEATLLDEAKLLVVDYPDGYQIVSSGAENTYYYGYVNPFSIYTIKDPVLPIAATDKYGTDILASVLAVDNNPAPMTPDDPDNFYIFDFGTIQHPENAKLVIDGWQDINSKIYLSTITIQPYVEVVDTNGAWVNVKSFGMPMGDLKTMVVDLSNKFLSSDQRIRLHLGIKKAQVWVVDRIRLDDSAPVSVTLQELQASSADLQFGGSSILSPPSRQHRMSAGDGGLPLNPDYFGYGNFTRYGGVGELVTQKDDKYVIMNYGDRLNLTFPALTAPQAGMKRGFVLKADNYYKDFKTYKYLEPLPFHGMSDYPPPAPQAYPTDADHQQYLVDYNTRILPGPANPTLTPQPSPTYASGGTAGITFQWSGVTAPDGDSVVYLVEVSSAANMATISYQSSWQTGTNWAQTLPVGTWYWRVTARDSIHTTSVFTSATGSFSIEAAQ